MKNINTKKTAYRLVASVIMILLVSLSLHYTTFITRDKENAWMHDAYNKLEKGTVEIFFVGNSHSFCSINTDLLKDKYGIDSFMMSASGQTMAMNYYAVREIIQDHNPKKIYLEMSYAVNEWDTINDEMSHMFFDGMKLDKTKVDGVNDLIDKSSRIYFYLPIGQYHTRWQNLTERDYRMDISPTGRYYSDHVEHCWPIEVIPDDEKTDMTENNRYYLDKIVALCKKTGIELILWTAPYNALYENENDIKVLRESQKVYNGISDYATLNKLQYINLFHNLDALNLDYETDFLDTQHFNCYGQDKLTNYMVEAKYICSSIR